MLAIAREERRLRRKAAGMKCRSPLKLHLRFVDVSATVSVPFSTSTINPLLGMVLTTSPSKHGLVANEQVGKARVSLITAVSFGTHATGCLLKLEPACSKNGFDVWLQRRMHTHSCHVSYKIEACTRAELRSSTATTSSRNPRGQLLPSNDLKNVDRCRVLPTTSHTLKSDCS